MALKITHDGTGPREPKERCCMCRSETRFWHASDVALCEVCAKKTKRAELPTKKEWWDKETKLMKLAGIRVY